MEIEEDIARLEEAGVIGEQAEDDPHQEAFQIWAAVARRLKRIVQSPDLFSRFDIGWVLIAKGPALHAEDEPERLHMGGQILEREGGGFPLVEIVQLEGLEVADQNVARAVLFGQGVNIRAGLIVGAGKIVPGALLFDDQDAWPEQVDEPRPIVQPLYVFFVAPNGPALLPENLEKLVIEALGIALLVRVIRPLASEISPRGRGSRSRTSA